MYTSYRQVIIARRRTIARTLLLIFAIQAIIPAGFMPANISAGWFVKLCPQGLSAETMQLFHPDHNSDLNDSYLNDVADHSNHHMGHHSKSADSVDNPKSPLHASWQKECEYSASVNNSFIAAVLNVSTADFIEQSQPVITVVWLPYSVAVLSQHRARAPPEQLMI